MLLDGDHLLLTDEAVPAAQGLGVVRRICVIGGHVATHHARRVAGDVEAGLEAVLQAHARHRLRIDPVPGSALGADQIVCLGDVVLVKHEPTS